MKKLKTYETSKESVEEFTKFLNWYVKQPPGNDEATVKKYFKDNNFGIFNMRIMKGSYKRYPIVELSSLVFSMFVFVPVMLYCFYKFAPYIEEFSHQLADYLSK